MTGSALRLNFRGMIHPALRAASLIPLLGTAAADVVAPPADYRAPVIAKVQIVFSMVSHHHHISDRVNFLNTHGVPRGSTNFAVPMLVYEPLVTLYNPYPERLVVQDGVRIRIWDPPVGFRFKKNDAWLRPAFADGEFQGLSYFYVRHQDDGAGRKTFTLHLTDGTASRAGRDVILEPGASATYAMRIESNWTWGYETASPYAPRSVFDWNWESDFTNIDNRTTNAGGVEAIPGWDVRAGFRTDHLSLAGARPPDTVYAFEGFYGTAGWVTTRLTDTVSVEAAPVRTAPEAADADFQVDLMPGRHNPNAPSVYQQIKFDLASLVASTPPPVRRNYLVENLLQTPNDLTMGGKAIFAVLTAAAKTPALVDGSLTRLGTTDAADRYDFRFDEAVTPNGVDQIGPLAPRPEIVEVLNVERHGEFVSVDLLSPLPGTETWESWGGESPGEIDESLSSESETVPGPGGTWLRRVNIRRMDWPERYFIQFRAPDAD